MLARLVSDVQGFPQRFSVPSGATFPSAGDLRSRLADLEWLPGLEQRLERREDVAPASADLPGGRRTRGDALVDHAQTARAAHRLDLPGEPRRRVRRNL